MPLPADSQLSASSSPPADCDFSRYLTPASRADLGQAA